MGSHWCYLCCSDDVAVLKVEEEEAAYVTRGAKKLANFLEAPLTLCLHSSSLLWTRCTYPYVVSQQDQEAMKLQQLALVLAVVAPANFVTSRPNNPCAGESRTDVRTDGVMR